MTMRRTFRKTFWHLYGVSRAYWVCVALAVVCAVVGWWSHNTFFSAGAAVVVCMLLARRAARAGRIAVSAIVQTPPDTRPSQDRPRDTATLVTGMMAEGRYALLLRPQLAERLSGEQVEQARTTMSECMTLIPGGTVVLSDDEPWNEDLDSEALRRAYDGETSDQAFLVEPAFIDRFAVTNQQYHEFVAAGGYSQLALWDHGIWPAVVGFVDRTNCPGPRGWVDGNYVAGEENLPVVGVNWHEASAYARWVGKRLPTDAEWVKAACWPGTIRADKSTQRRFPWGNSMDPDAANIWGGGPGHLVPVDTYPQGRSMGGVHHMVGNCWEWTLGSFDIATQLAEGEDCQIEPVAHTVTGDVVMKNIHGGAFDTYFDTHAANQFRSGELSIARKHNIGFRCAVGACDLATAQAATPHPEPVAIAEPPAGAESESTAELEVGVNA